MAADLVLALDGATDVCSAALLRLPSPVASSPEATAGGDTRGGWQLIDESAATDGKAQARVLLHLVDDMLRAHGAVAADVGALVVGTGPGTFTGVRITVATARALALALSVPVLGVSSLAALAAEAACTTHAMSKRAGETGAEPRLPGVIVPVIDARRGQLFYGVYRRRQDAGETSWRRESGFEVCDRGRLGSVCEGLAREAGEGVVVIGDASLREGSGLPSPGGRTAATFDVEFRETAVAASRLLRGQEHLSEPGPSPSGSDLKPYLLSATTGNAAPLVPGTAGSPEGVKPIYVRPPDADMHITKMRDPWRAR